MKRNKIRILRTWLGERERQRDRDRQTDRDRDNIRIEKANKE